MVGNFVYNFILIVQETTAQKESNEVQYPAFGIKTEYLDNKSKYLVKLIYKLSVNVEN